MKKITMIFLSAMVALIVILTGCSQSGADSNKKETTTSTSQDSTTPTVTVTPEKEQLLKEAMESAKQGKAVKVDTYKEITYEEVIKVFGGADLDTIADGGGGAVYKAGKYELDFLFDGPIGGDLKITEISVNPYKTNLN
jgi:maltose-binding protein MalE